MTVIIRNISGGTMGALSWGSAYMFEGSTAPSIPASNKYLKVSFQYTGTHWIGCVSENSFFVMDRLFW